MPDASMEERLAQVRARIETACANAGRDPSTVRLVAVSKTYGPEVIREAAACGVEVFGENRVQEAAAKIDLAPPGLEWHLVGHLQTNKARQAVRLFDLVHSVDSPKLLEAVERLAAEEGGIQAVLIQVNVAGEDSKFGLAPEEGLRVIESAQAFMPVDIRGLMTMPPFTPDPEQAAPHFCALRRLRDEWKTRTGLALDELSMGMSHDFEIAIREGATLIRVGTALFGKRGEKTWPPH